MTEEVRETKSKTSAVVTFLIGNGFDIGLGLNTEYANFVNAYLQQPSKTDVIVKLKKAINQDAGFWGDAELAFGKLPFSTFGKDSYSVVKECVTDFSDALSEYLKNEERRFQISDEKIKVAFCSLLCSYYQRLGEYPRRNELKRLKQFNRLKINVINFNYTETIDKMLPQSGTMALPGWGRIDVQINEVCHVHGALSAETSRSFGVNMSSQIEDSKLIPDARMLLVKPEVDRLARWGLESIAKEMIDESDTVVLFGLSLGATDQLWWNYLLDYIQYKPEHRLCLMQYVKSARGTRVPGEEGLWAQRECRKFYNAVDPQKMKYVNTTDLDRRIDVSIRGPHLDPDGHETFCDPFQLTWFGKKLVADRPQFLVLPSSSSSSSNP